MCLVSSSAFPANKPDACNGATNWLAKAIAIGYMGEAAFMAARKCLGRLSHSLSCRIGGLTRSECPFVEHYAVCQEVIEKAGDDKCCPVAIYHVPFENLLENEQEQHFDQEPYYTREVEDEEPFPEIGLAFVADALAPYPTV